MRSIVRKLFSRQVPEFDISDSGFVENPYPTFEYLRNVESVQQLKSGAWAFLGYDDVAAAFTDKRLGNSPSPYAIVRKENRDKYVCANVANNILPFMDSPEHDIPRKNIIQAFRNTMKDIDLNMETIGESILQEKLAKGKMELISEFATPFSYAVMCSVFDLPIADRPQLEKWCNYFFYLFMPIPSKEILANVEKALSEFRQYFRTKLDERRKSPQKDLLSQLAVAESGGVRLTDEQIIDNAMLLFADGIENVDKGIANAFLCLLRHPEQWNYLQNHPDRIPQATEECLRFESPAQYVGRIAKEDIQLNGHLIKKNMPVLLVLGAVNRDPKVFEKPDEFSIHRHPNKHLSFGKAKHSCVGGGLVTNEIRASLSVFAGNTKNLKLPVQELVWLPRAGHRWLKELHVEF